jgi:hypothetical protein
MKLACLILFYFGICFGAKAQVIFMAKLKTLNPETNGILVGSTTIYVKDDQLLSYVRLFAGAPKAWHMQNVYLGNRCPTIDDDLNKDGFIDIAEGNNVWGNVLIPLDGNLNSQASGLNTFPVADDYGAYFYEKEASFSSFLKDLRSPDLNPGDNIAKLKPNESWNLEGKVMVIQGVANQPFPETVTTYGLFYAYQTLPIACGVFIRLQ